MGDILVDVENVSKKYCRNLHRSLLYGVRDIASDLSGMGVRHGDALRTGEFWALRNVSFQLRRGECVGLMGPNGAGKSTMLKILNGLVKPDAGRVTIKGRMGALIELGAGFHPILTGRENIYINGAILGLKKHEIRRRLEEIVEFSQIGDAIDAPVRTYSSGMKVRLGFAIAAHLRPDLLLVDEVLAVGDVGFRMKCYAHINKLIDSGMSIILVSHHLTTLSRIARRAIVIGKGEKLHDGVLEEAVVLYDRLTATKIEPEVEKSEGTRIEKITLLGGDGTLHNDFATGGSLTADVLLHTEQPIAGARLRAWIESPMLGVLGSFATTASSFHFDLNSPRTLVRLTLPRLPLQVGAYSLNMGLYGAQDDEFYDQRQPGAAFQVTRPTGREFGRAGVFEFQHQWTLPDVSHTGRFPVPALSQLSLDKCA